MPRPPARILFASGAAQATPQFKIVHLTHERDQQNEALYTIIGTCCMRLNEHIIPMCWSCQYKSHSSRMMMHQRDSFACMLVQCSCVVLNFCEQYQTFRPIGGRRGAKECSWRAEGCQELQSYDPILNRGEIVIFLPQRWISQPLVTLLLKLVNSLFSN